MKKAFLISVATTALIGAGGFAIAQSPNNAPSPPAAQSAPADSQGAPSEKTAPMNRGNAPDTKARSDIKSDNGMKGSQADQKPPGDKNAVQHTQDNTKGDPKSKDMNKDMKSKGADSETKPGVGGKAAADTGTERSKDGMKADPKAAADSKAGTTTGQAGAGAKLTTEQRSSVRTAIGRQNVKPATNVNFSISVGTRVPRTVGFHSMPTELITIYPSWKGYEYFLVGDQIIVVNPRTLEIVAVLEA